MNRQLALLIELGDLEARLADLRERRRLIPLQLEENKAALTRLNSAIEDKDKELEDLRHERRMIEQEVEDERYKLGKHKVQLLQLKTNREYEAMEHEIEAGEQKISRLEDRILELMEKDDEIAAFLKEQGLKCGEKEGEVDGRNRELADEDRSLESEIAGLERSVAAITEKIDEQLYREYERIRNGKNNHQAVVPLTPKGACGGCYGTVPLQMINEVRKAERIITCYNCGRILYHPDMEGDRA